MYLLFAIAFASHYSISITLRCAFAIVYTSMACYTFNYTSMDNNFSFATTFFYIIYASTKCYFSTLSSSDSLVHTGSSGVALGPICSIIHQRHLLLCKNSTTNVPIVSMS
jgi:hypothetical protein